MSISDEDIERALDFLQDNAMEAAQARANRLGLERFRDRLKALIMKEHLNLGVTAQEREAYADPRYQEHIDGYKEAVKIDEYHRHMRDTAHDKIEAWRTMSSNQRAKI